VNFLSRYLNEKRRPAFALVVILLAIAPFFLSDFRVNLLGKFIAYAILALGIDLIWGYTGILSMGHGVFFGLGAYCFAMYLKLESSGFKLPDFMSWSGLSSIPWFWKPFTNPVFAIIMALVVPTLIAFIIGFLTFKNRIQGVYFSILSQALAVIISVLFIGQQAYTGGSNGITDCNQIFGYSLASPTTKVVLYYVALALLIAAFSLCDFIVGRKMGKVLVAIRDGENRVRFSGYNPTGYKVAVYCISALLAGVAGAIYFPQVGIITPTEMGITPSIEMVIWVAIGGKGSLIGAVIAAILVNALKSGISDTFPDVWSYFIGIAFVLVVLFMPNGIVGKVSEFKKKKIKFLK
jgi:urea transport system permease protein